MVCKPEWFWDQFQVLRFVSQVIIWFSSMVPVSKSRFRGIVFTSFQTIEQANPNILQALFTNRFIHKGFFLTSIL